MADQLVPFEVAFVIGQNIDPENAGDITVKIISTSNTGGKHLDSAKFVVEYGVSANDMICYDAGGAAGYVVKDHELGFPTKAKVGVNIIDLTADPEASITTVNEVTYLNLKIPVNFSKKKESGSITFKED